MFVIIKEMPSRRKLPPQLKRMSQIVKKLSRAGVKKNLFKKAAKVYHAENNQHNKRSPRMRIMF